MRIVGVLLALLLASFTSAALAAGDGAVTVFPKKLDPDCRGGRAKTYDQCADQFALYTKAFETAQAEEKVLLVSLGAEWCVWCHVFSYTVAIADAPLEQFTAERFVIAHIDAEYGKNYQQVLRATAADTVYTGGLPLIFVVAADGTFAGAIDHKSVADGTQYNLDSLQEELGRLYASALIPNDPYRKILRQLPPIGGWPEGEGPDEMHITEPTEDGPPSP